MNYTKLEVTRGAIRDALVLFLREKIRRFTLTEPSGISIGREQVWVDEGLQKGLKKTDFTNEIYQMLLSMGHIQQTSVTVMSSTEMHLGAAYNPILVKTLIFEEIAKLIRIGALLEAKYVQPTTLNYDLVLQPDKDWVILTGYGARFVSNVEVIPYEAEAYIGRLRKIAELDDELVAYLGEGLACLQDGHARAAAVLLRLCEEHILNRLIEAINNKLPDEQRKKKFEQNISRARGSIEKRAEVTFSILSSDNLFLANDALLKSQLEIQLSPAFHTIRELGGDAAHPSIVIDVEQVMHHYYMFAEAIYRIAIKIVQHLQQP